MMPGLTSRKSDLTGLGCGWGMRLEQIPGDADVQAVLTARAIGSSFQNVIPGLTDSKSVTREMCEECKVLGFTLDLLSEKP